MRRAIISSAVAAPFQGFAKKLLSQNWSERRGAAIISFCLADVKKAMRATLPITLLFATLLSACAATSAPSPTGKHPQSGTLKAHPGLLGQSDAPAAPATPQSAPASETK
jgi:hypothetical protein